MGGAFVALADDATAAYSNPAGLTILERPEVSIEARSWETTTIHTHSGSAFPGGLQQVELAQSSSRVDGISFLSYVHVGDSGRWAVALYRHALVDFESAFDSPGVLSTSPPLFGPFSFSTRLEIQNHGLSGSYQPRDGLRLGAGVSYFTFDLLTSQIIFADPPNQHIIVTTAGKTGDDGAFGFNLGFLWQVTPVWAIGGAYRQGPRFEMNEFFRGTFSIDTRFKVPNQFAIGASYQPNDRLTVLFELDRIEYSDLMKGNRLGTGEFGRFELEDALELRLGAEYLFMLSRGNSVALMAGAWYDPDHTIVFRGACTGTSSCFRYAYFQDTGRDEVHLTAGVGVKMGRFGFDLGADLSRRVDTVALSSVVRF
jgi:long-chain fatty acid transport protein